MLTTVQYILLGSLAWFSSCSLCCKFSFWIPDDLSKCFGKVIGLLLKTLSSLLKQGGFSLALFLRSFFCCPCLCDMNSSEREFWFYIYRHLYPHIHMLLNTRLSHSKCSYFASTISKAPKYFVLTIFLWLLLFCCCSSSSFLLLSKSRTFSTMAFHSAWSLALLLYLFGYIENVKTLSKK